MDELNRNQSQETTVHNILYLSYDGMTDALGQSQVLPYLCKLGQYGLVFHLISFEKSEKFNLHKNHIQAICDQHGIVWYPQKYTENTPFVTTLWDMLTMRKLAFKLHRQFNFQVVHCRSYISALVGLQMKRKKDVKFIFDMRGFWADERVDGGLWDLKKPIYKFVYTYFKRKEVQFLRESDFTISLTEAGKNEIESWECFAAHKPQIKIIPCCVDLDLFSPEKILPASKAELKQSLSLHDSEHVLGYVGSIGTWYLLEEMLTYFSVYKRYKSNLKFLFVTNEKKETIVNQAVKLGVDVEDLRIVSCLHKDVPLYISLFDESIFFIKPTYSKQASSPTKQGEIMAMGIPLICNSGIGDTDSIVRKYQAGKVIDQLEQNNFKKSIQALSNDNREQIKKGAQEYYSLEIGVKSYAAVYSSLITFQNKEVIAPSVEFNEGILEVNELRV